MITDQFTKQFDELGLSIADLIVQEAECCEVYKQAMQYNIEAGEEPSECFFHANYQVKCFVVERQKRLESESEEYFGLSFTPDEAFISWENVYKQSV